MLTRRFGQISVDRHAISENPELVRDMFRKVDALIVETVNDFCNDAIRYLFHSELLPEMDEGAQPTLCIVQVERDADADKCVIVSYDIKVVPKGSNV